MDMKKKKTMFKTVLAASLAAASLSMFYFGEAQCAPVPAHPVAELAQDGKVFYQNSGMRLLVPEQYDSLVLTTTPRKTGDGVLFSVYEKASVEAAEALGFSSDGPGWLFAIGWVDEAGFHDLLCKDMSGMEIFAKDNLGNRYIFYHPTDVRYMRKDAAAMKKDEKQWTLLNQWAWGNVRYDFIQDNLQLGLTAETFDNSMVGIYLARAAYQPNVKYTVSTTKYGPLSSREVKAVPYVERLIRGARYQMVDISATPDGEYVVLSFPEENIRFDFFKLRGSENYVREVHGDGTEILYRATFDDGETKASAVMQAWYEALAM